MPSHATATMPTAKTMNVRANIDVDFHLCPDGEHTLALLADVTPTVALTVGDLVNATDGEVEHLAVVDSINDDVVSLVLMRSAAVAS